MTEPDLRFVSWLGFAPSYPYPAHDSEEIWTYTTDSVKHGKDKYGRNIITIVIALDKPEKRLQSRENAHP